VAKKSKPVMPVDVLADESSFDPFFQSVTENAKANYPGNVYSGTEAEQLLVALPVPSLAIRYLLQQEGWPLGRFTMIVGQQESCKSAFVYEICRWHRLAKGRGVYIDTEFKPAPELMMSIMGYDTKAVDYQKCRTLDEWEGALLNWIEQYKLAMDGTDNKPGIGRIVPICMAVDSLTAALSEKTYDDLIAAGHSQSRFATEAKSITDYLKVMTKMLDGYPMSVVGVNHLKHGTTPTGVPVRNIGGGAGLRFHQATEIELRRKTAINPTAKSSSLRRNINGQAAEGIEVTMAVMKNSNAPHQHLDVEMLWYTDYDAKQEVCTVDPETGEVRRELTFPQRTFFDWHSAAIDILLSIQREKTKQSKLLCEVLEIVSGDDRRHSYCKELGVTEKSKVSWAELGVRLEERLASDRSFADALYPILGIRRRVMFKPGVDYRDCYRQAANQVGATPSEEAE